LIERKRIEDTTPDDYAAMGFRSGLEIHQQLDTAKKLFCRCPVEPYTEEFHAEILRHMRPTLSELGEYDGTALMEFKTKKEIIYQIHQDTVCTYEMDDTPPFELNEEALDIALEITMLLSCNLVSEVHIARKQYLDGSIPTGFQRTTILGVDGWIPYRDRRIGIKQLGLEEDACREVSDVGHMRTYRTGRLGIPLIETVTYPDMRTPEEVGDVAQIIRWLTRATGKVRRGIGAARQDVNVSVEGGRRVEIKGVSRIPLIPLLVHNEAFRQLALLDIKSELERRKITQSTFKSDKYDVTGIIKETQYDPLARALDKQPQIRAVVLRGFKGILKTRTQPETTFAKEISDRVRVIACLDICPNIAHSDMEGETLSSTTWSKIKKHTRTGDNDTVVIVWGEGRDVETASEEIAIRAKEATDGVPNETRQAFPDGTNGFERILPGPDRMYPDTDLPPLAITEEHMEQIRSRLPETPWDREERYLEMGLSPTAAHLMSTADEKDLFDKAAAGGTYTPQQLASFMLNKLRWMKRAGTVPNLDDDTFMATVNEAGKRKLPAETIPLLIEMTCGNLKNEASQAAEDLGFSGITALKGDITSMVRRIERPPIEAEKLKHYLMGKIMKRYRGKVEGRDVSELLENLIAGELSSAL